MKKVMATKLFSFAGRLLSSKAGRACRHEQRTREEISSDDSLRYGALSSIEMDSLGKWDVRELRYLCSVLDLGLSFQDLLNGDEFPAGFGRRYSDFCMIHRLCHTDNPGPLGYSAEEAELMSERKYIRFALRYTMTRARSDFLQTKARLRFYLKVLRRWCYDSIHGHTDKSIGTKSFHEWITGFHEEKFPLGDNLGKGYRNVRR